MTISNIPTLLLVDDDPLIRDSLDYCLADAFTVVAVGSRDEAIERVRAMAEPPPLALVDLGLPPSPHHPDEGFALIGELLAHDASIQIIVLSGQDEAAHGRHARSLGAIDFVAKPVDPLRLRQLLQQALSCRNADIDEHAHKAAGGLIGNSPAIQKVRLQLSQYADSPFPVLIEGESGSGKEIVASRHLHAMTERRGRPYLALNCAAISPTLIEPTLFGYAKGAFTGAVSARSGYFEDGGDGTLFLDEIGELPLELQPKLLRVLENGEFQRVGETRTRTSRARVVAATNRDLRREVREGRFRADLYHRLSVFTVSVPPLRDMGRDRLLLLEHYRQLFSRQSRQPSFLFTDDAERRWLDYPFPGNVRELRNIVVRLAVKYAGKSVALAELEAELDVPVNEHQRDWQVPQDPESLVQIAQHQLQGRDGFNLDETLRCWEGAYIEAAQRLAHGNLSQAARLLGINRTTLYHRMGTQSQRAAQPPSNRGD